MCPGTWNGKTHFQNIKRSVRCIGDTFAAQASCDRIAEYIQDEYSGQPSEHALNPLCVSYIGWRWCAGNHLPLSWPTTTKRWSVPTIAALCPWERKCKMQITHGLWSSIIAAVEQEPSRIWRNIAWKVGLSQPKVFEVLLGDQFAAHFLLHTMALYGCNFTTGYIFSLRLSYLLRSSLSTCEACVVHEAVFNVGNRHLWVG